MALPPKGDPQRPLALAVRSTRILGILFIGLGLCGTLPMMLAPAAAGCPSAWPIGFDAVVQAEPRPVLPIEDHDVPPAAR